MTSSLRLSVIITCCFVSVSISDELLRDDTLQSRSLSRKSFKIYVIKLFPNPLSLHHLFTHRNHHSANDRVKLTRKRRASIRNAKLFQLKLLFLLFSLVDLSLPEVRARNLQNLLVFSYLITRKNYSQHDAGEGDEFGWLHRSFG